MSEFFLIEYFSKKDTFLEKKLKKNFLKYFF